MINNPVVAYRLRRGKKYTGEDNEVICLPCHDLGIGADEERAIVLRSENGQRIRAGTIKCSTCGKTIRILHDQE